MKQALFLALAGAAGAGITYYLIKRKCPCKAAATTSSSSSSEAADQPAITVKNAPSSPNVFSPGTGESSRGGCTDCDGAPTARAAWSA